MPKKAKKSLTELDGAKSAAARDDTIARVDAGADVEWMKRACGFIRAKAKEGNPFTTDDLWAVLEKPPEARAMGAAVRRMASHGIIVPLEMVKTTQVSRHRGYTMRWGPGPNA